MPFYESQPTIYPLHRLLEEVLRGEIQVPRFQRPGTENTWKPKQRGDLLDSIHRGYPIGTILLWSTKESINRMPVVGGARIPEPPDRQRLRLVLDGHQRLSTLIAILGPGLKDHDATGEGALDERWAFDLSDDRASASSTKPLAVRRDRFVLLKQEPSPDDKHLPLDVAIDRVKLNEWVRGRSTLSSREIGRADALRDRFREYSLPVASLVTESLDEATDSFHRINSSGTPMDDFHMVAALAYTQDFDLQEAVDTIRDELLEPEGWADVGETDVLRVCAGLVRHRLKKPSQHPAKLDIHGLATALRDDQAIIEHAGKALAATTSLLRSFGVHGPGILPYAWQLIVLAIEVGRRPLVEFGAHETRSLERWFWLTTYGGVFAGVNSAVVDRAGKALGDMLQGGGWSAMRRDTTQQIVEPDRFDFRAVRSRGLVLQMARQSDRDDLNGVGHRALAQGASSLRTLEPRLGRSTWYNLVIEPDLGRLRDLRTALRARGAGHDGGPEDDTLLAGIAVEPGDRGTVDELLEKRRARLLQRERAFVGELGLIWSDGAATGP